MYKYIIQKMIASIITLFVIIVVFYFVVVSVKGNPIDAEQFVDNPESYDAILKQYGIDEPVYIRFGKWISGVFNGEWGDVYNLKSTESLTIPDRFFKPLKYSMWVFIPSYILGMIFGILLGFWAGYKRGKTIDLVINFVLTLFIAVPGFLLAPFVLFGAYLIDIPVQFQSLESPGVTSSLFAQSLLAPIFVTTITSLSGWAYFLRNEVGKILVSDYVLAAKTKGFSKTFIFKRYVLRNSLYPIIGSIVTMYMVVFGGSIVVERFFGVPGTSTLMLEASKKGEINILMFNLIFFASIGIFSQVLVDICQYSIDPIVKLNFSSKPSPLKKLKSLLARNKSLLVQIRKDIPNEKRSKNI